MYKKAQAHFKKADPLLHKASLEHHIEDITASKDLFRDIVRAISAQQLSGKAADTIFGRLNVLMGKNGLTPKKILATTDISLRKCGFSEAKVVAIKSLATAIIKGDLNPKNIHLLENTKVIETLTKVKGIGPWTAEMILMFSLGRHDIFSAGDLGLKKGIMYLYDLKKLPSKKKINQLSKAWSPYRTYAARVLWRVADARKEVNSKR